MGKTPQQLIMMKPLIGLDGVQKMSSSKHNYIGITESSDQMFGKVMSLPDSEIASYAELAAWLPADEVKKITDLHPRTAKFDVAAKIVALYHGEDEAQNAGERFNRTFRDRDVATSVASQIIIDKPHLTLQQIIAQVLQVSMSEAERLITQGGVKVNDQVLTNTRQQFDEDQKVRLQVGKHRFFEVEWKVE